MYLSVEVHIPSFFQKKNKYNREKGTGVCVNQRRLQQAVQGKST